MCEFFRWQILLNEGSKFYSNEIFTFYIQGNLKVIEENKNLTKDCYYLFELSHSIMCDLESSSSGLSSGSVICIV